MAKRTLKSRVLFKLLILLQREILFDEATKRVVALYRGEKGHFSYHPQVTERWVLKLWNDLKDKITD